MVHLRELGKLVVKRSVQILLPCDGLFPGREEGCAGKTLLPAQQITCQQEDWYEVYETPGPHLMRPARRPKSMM